MSYCPECGAQILDGSKFCPNCGRPLTVSNPTSPLPSGVKQWENEDYLFTYNPDWSKHFLLWTDKTSEAAAKLQFWQDSQKDILPGIQKKIDQGWQPVTEVGPGAIKVQIYTDNSWNVVDLVFAVITVGLWAIAKMIGLVSSRMWVAVEFRVQMRRPV